VNGEVYEFGQCELRVAERELRVQGQPRAIEPLPFDLLLLLLRERHRVLPRDELMDRLWPGQAVSPGALARAVMKVRQAIGDADREAPLIRTLYGSGHRFVGEVRTPAAAPAGVVLALLPVANHTGQPDLDWVELGLPSLVQRRLQRHPRLEVASVPAVLMALQQAQLTGMSVAAQVQGLQRLSGVRHVAQAQLACGSGGFRLQVSLYDPQGLSCEAVLPGSDATSLAHVLVRWLEQHLLGEAVPASATRGDDETLDVVFARALQAVAQQRWQLALSLLDTVLQAQPAHLPAQCERLRALVALDDSRAFELGEQLLASLAHHADPLLQAQVHLELAQAHVRRRHTGTAAGHVAQAMQAARHDPHGELTLAITLLRASIAMIEVDFALAATLLDDAERWCGQQGHVFDRIRISSMRVVLEAETGQMARACEQARRVAALYRDHGVLVGQARAECNYANACASLGRFSLAVQHGEAALAVSRSLQVPTDTAASAALLCGLYRSLKKPLSLDRVLAWLPEPEAGPAPRADLLRLVCRAQRALARAEPAQAVELLRQAEAEAEAGGEALQLHFVLPLLVSAQVLAGRLLEAEQTGRRVQALPQFSRDRHLQAALLHGQAHLALVQGERVLALQLLQQGAALTPPGWWNAHARLDSAWLLLEDGRLAEAQRELQGLDAWLDEHPAGRALRARLCHAQGRSEEALGLHQRLVASFEGGPSALHQALGQGYEAAHRRGASRPTLPVLPQLLTTL